ncbi:MAG TPA: PaaI family thioesterase [Acidimicrobiia bacterium]|nr:PaaI family thioesterase [Acidimicrobiia bacterium]
MTYRVITGKVLPVPRPEMLAQVPKAHLPTCFGCGSENEICLGIVPEYVDGKVVADLSFHPRFEGGPGLVHGGAIAAFFDDLIGFVPMTHMRPAVTANLCVNYRKPIPLGVTIRGEAWLTASEGRKLWCEAVGFAPDGTVLVEVTSLFLEVAAEHFTKAIEGARGPYPEAFYQKDEYYP